MCVCVCVCWKSTVSWLMGAEGGGESRGSHLALLDPSALDHEDLVKSTAVYGTWPSGGVCTVAVCFPLPGAVVMGAFLELLPQGSFCFRELLSFYNRLLSPEGGARPVGCLCSWAGPAVSSAHFFPVKPSVSISGFGFSQSHQG